MKKIIVLFFAIILLSGCGKSNEEKVFDKFKSAINDSKSYLLNGSLEIYNDQDSFNYAISVDNSSQYPNEKGNFILYAHSGNSSIAYFKNLYNVQMNDDVFVYYNGVKYHYIIYEKYNIKKTGKASIIKSKEEKYITLITCDQNKKNEQIVILGKLINEKNY